MWTPSLNWFCTFWAYIHICKHTHTHIVIDWGFCSWPWCGFRCREWTVICLWPVTVVLQLQIQWTEVQLCFVRMRSYCYVLYCSVCLQLCINLDLSLAVNETSNKYLTSGEQYLLKYYVLQWQRLMFRDEVYVLVLRDSTLAVRFKCIFLRKTHWIQIYTYIRHLIKH